MRLATAMTARPAYGLGDLHDVWIVLGGQVTTEMVAEAQRQGAEVWTYICTIMAHEPLDERHYAGLYVWAKVPEGWTSAALATELLDSHSVVVTPGRGYGEHGEGYIRLSLTTPDDRVEEGLRRLEGWQIPDPPTTV